MGKIIHQSHITITRENGPTRIARIRGFDQPVYYGVHGGIKKFYNVDPEVEHAATLDHLVGAVGGWMMGTLATVLAKKKIRTFQDRYMATVTGDIEDVSGVLKIVRINVRYNLQLPAEKRPEAEEAFNSYIILCPAAQSVIEAIKITHELEMTDEE